MSKPTVLYRHWDKDDNLLYVGISKTFMYRLQQHNDDSSWFKDIAKITLEHCETRQAALISETLAIATETPRHNVRLNSGGNIKVVKEKKRRIKDTSKLVAGLSVTSYKELCAILGIVCIGGDSKIAILKELTTYCSFTVNKNYSIDILEVH